MTLNALEIAIPIVGRGLTAEQKIDWLTEMLVNYAKERDDLRAALTQAASWFADYAEMHRAKGADDKANRNQERADFCAKALEGK